MSDRMVIYTPDIVAGMIRAAFIEGAAVERSATPVDEQWLASKAHRDAASMIRVQSEHGVAEKALSILRLWANCSPEGTTPEASWKRASGLMKQLHELIGDPPLDTEPPKEPTDGR